jgi:hypothetical protein
MFGLYIVIENDESRRTKVGPFTAELREVVSNYEEAHTALDRLLELMGIEEAERSSWIPGMGSVEGGPLV